MGDYALYFETGWRHILSWDALDHILFIAALTAVFLAENWKEVLILVTAFTIGHSVTLALSAYDIIRFNAGLVELLIPCTIIATGLFNLFTKKFKAQTLQLNYFLALFFGLVHGMGFANTIRFMLAKDQNILIPLLSFNIGLEAGQIVVVSAILLLGYLAVNLAGLNRKWWVWSLSALAICISLKILFERL